MCWACAEVFMWTGWGPPILRNSVWDLQWYWRYDHLSNLKAWKPYRHLSIMAMPAIPSRPTLLLSALEKPYPHWSSIRQVLLTFGHLVLYTKLAPITKACLLELLKKNIIPTHQHTYQPTGLWLNRCSSTKRSSRPSPPPFHQRKNSVPQ